MAMTTSKQAAQEAVMALVLGANQMLPQTHDRSIGRCLF